LSDKLIVPIEKVTKEEFRRMYPDINGWISVKDRLPDRQERGYQTYIVASWSHQRKIYSIGAYDWRDNYFQDCFGEKMLMDDGYWEVTHWMPLPEAPK